KRSTTSGTETTIASTTNSAYADTSALSGTTYFYVVTAVNPGGENPTNSNEVSAMAVSPLFNAPNGIVLDGAGANLFIADESNNAVEELNLANNQTVTYLNAANGISRPVDVAAGSGGQLFVLNQGTGGNGSILEFDQFKNTLATN